MQEFGTPPDPFQFLRGKIVLELKIDEFGRGACFAPNLPPHEVIRHLFMIAIDMLCQQLHQQKIIRPA